VKIVKAVVQRIADSEAMPTTNAHEYFMSAAALPMAGHFSTSLSSPAMYNVLV